jgi:hypothetical protein
MAHGGMGGAEAKLASGVRVRVCKAGEARLGGALTVGNRQSQRPEGRRLVER